MTPRFRLVALVALLFAAPRLLESQERGATALGEAVAGLDVTARVLVIGAHPDDEDTNLITWLARGRQVETAYLSLTRGDGGQNLIGNELGPLLGMIRTEELLAARRLDGGRQFFTRAYDFGFSKTAEETYTHWPKDSILRDVVTVVRAFRPQIIVAVFSGTPRDGHGHHQVSAILAREAYDAAADTVRFPSRQTLGYAAWTPSKFYRAARFNPTDATVGFNVGELSPFRGMTYAEIASQSRSQHLSQGFGALQRRGTVMDYLKLEESRVSAPLTRERSPLDAIESGWGRFTSAAVTAATRAAVDSLPAAIAAVRIVERLTDPAAMVRPLARVVDLVTRARADMRCGGNPCSDGSMSGASGDLATSLETVRRRATAALLAAAGVLVEATAPRELLAVGDTLPVTIAVYNQGRAALRVEKVSAWTANDFDGPTTNVLADVAPDSATRVTLPLVGMAPSVPWWLEIGRRGDVFVLPGAGSTAAAALGRGEERIASTYTRAFLRIEGVPVVADAGPVVFRFGDPARGEQRRPLAVVPSISVRFDGQLELARAGVQIDRTFAIHLQSSTSVPRGVTLELSLPNGLTADSVVRRAALPAFGSTTLHFRVRGSLSKGTHLLGVTATSNGEKFTKGFETIEYAHIRPMRYYPFAAVQLEAVDAKLPPRTRIAYITGVGDNVGPLLGQLGLQVTTLSAERLASEDLSMFSAIVVGPRAFAATPALAAQAPRLDAFARAGGTVVMQYGQNEMQVPGILPYPITLARTAERVTDETAPVRVLDPRARVLASPNRIVAEDFAGWVQERATYMPTTVDPHWQRVLEMHDPNETPNENAVLVAPVGKGAYVYVTLALFRQLPAGVPGAARLFLNLVAADGRMSTPSVPTP